MLPDKEGAMTYAVRGLIYYAECAVDENFQIILPTFIYVSPQKRSF